MNEKCKQSGHSKTTSSYSKTGHGSSVGSEFASQPAVPQLTLTFGTFFRGKKKFPLPLIQEELVVSYWRKNGHLILANCLQEACRGTVWLGN